jgi:hypothetical protein
VYFCIFSKSIEILKPFVVKALFVLDSKVVGIESARTERKGWLNKNSTLNFVKSST